MAERLLILGGTAEAADLTEAASARFASRLQVTTSLAGRLPPPRDYPGALRIGGFGGTEGLVDYLRTARIGFVVDATHPFAATISGHAAAACAATGTPRLLLLRPPWTPRPEDRWHMVADFAAAADAVKAVAKRAFLAIGSGELAAFSDARDVHFLVRLMRPAAEPLPLARYDVVTGRPPFSLEAERALLERERIDTLVAKQSGGPTAAKLAAARATGARVIMVARPEKPAGPRVETVAAALAWLGARLAAGARD
ncbi:MAG: cobalt-precorrin-6A reductase [Rhodospirillales bacterium]|nr:cobalt-precorrin-6A reductase [Rhodospirillales bacterium]